MLIIWNDFDEIKGLPEVNVEHKIKRLQGQVLNLMCKITQYLGYRTLPVPYIKFEMHNCISLGCLLVLIFKSIGMGQTLNHLVIIDISTLAFQKYPVQHTSLESSVANWKFISKLLHVCVKIIDLDFETCWSHFFCRWTEVTLFVATLQCVGLVWTSVFCALIRNRFLCICLGVW